MCKCGYLSDIIKQVHISTDITDARTHKQTNKHTHKFPLTSSCLPLLSKQFSVLSNFNCYWYCRRSRLTEQCSQCLAFHWATSHSHMTYVINVLRSVICKTNSPTSVITFLHWELIMSLYVDGAYIIISTSRNASAI